MPSELGVWTADDCALVLIDYQTEMVEVIRSETNSDLVELHARLLAKTAKAFDVPIVLSTVGVGYGFNGPTVSSLLSELDGVEPIDRTSMNAFEDEAFRAAVDGNRTQAADHRRSPHGDLPRLRDGRGTEGRLRGHVRDRRRRWAFPGRAPDRIERLSHAGAVPTTALAVTTELFRDWAGPLYEQALDVIYWYFREVPEHTDQVGVADAEKRAAAARTAP